MSTTDLVERLNGKVWFSRKTHYQTDFPDEIVADKTPHEAASGLSRLRAELDEARRLLKSARHHVESEGDATLLTVIDAALKEGTPC